MGAGQGRSPPGLPPEPHGGECGAWGSAPHSAVGIYDQTAIRYENCLHIVSVSCIISVLIQFTLVRYERATIMARQGITFEQVAAVADALAGEGQQPTIRAVRERLGDTGSPNTIHKHLTAWREARPVAAAAAQELPQALRLQLRRS